MYYSTLLITGWLIQLSQLFQPFVTPGPAPAQVDGALARGVRGPRDADPTTCATPREGKQCPAVFFGFKGRAIPCVVFFNSYFLKTN